MASQVHTALPLARRRVQGAFTIVTAAALLLAVAGCSTASPTAAKPKDYGLVNPGVITAAIDDGAPFASTDAEGKPVGMLVDLNRIIAKRLGVKIVFKATDMTAGFAGMTSGVYDMMSIGMVASPERAKNVAFTKPIFWGQNVVLVRDGSTIASATGLNGKRLGATQSSTQFDYAQKNLPTAQLVSEPSVSAGISQLLNENLDAFMLGITQASVLVPQHPGKLKIALSAPQDNPGCQGINRSEKMFQKAYDEQLTRAVNDGTMVRLYDKYFADLDVPFPTQMYRYWPQLKKQIDKKS